MPDKVIIEVRNDTGEGDVATVKQGDKTLATFGLKAWQEPAVAWAHLWCICNGLGWPEVKRL